jgi:signal transduction histidine kinase
MTRYGYSREEFLQVRISDIRPPETVPSLLANRTVERPLLHFAGEWRHRLKDGQIIDVELTSHPLEYGGRKAALVVAQNITLRKRAEHALQVKTEELKGMSAQLWQAARLATMGELAASIAHELNNPLTTVNLRIEDVLGRMPPEDRKRRSLEVIAQEVEHMSKLVANLLAFSRRSQPQVSSVEMGGELDNTIETVLCKMLSEQGYETVGCTSGGEALERLKQRDFDLLLADLMMPEMDGIALIRAALELDPQLVAIIMTG